MISCYRKTAVAALQQRCRAEERDREKGEGKGREGQNRWARHSLTQVLNKQTVAEKNILLRPWTQAIYSN